MMSMDVLWLGLMLDFHGLPRKVNDMTSKMKEFKDDERRPPFHWCRNGEMAVATHLTNIVGNICILKVSLK